MVEQVDPLFDRLRPIMPELPSPLTVLTKDNGGIMGYFNLSQAIRNKGITSFGLNKWQKSSFLIRRAEDIAFSFIQMKWNEYGPYISILTPIQVLSVFNNTLKRDEVWGGVISALCSDTNLTPLQKRSASSFFWELFMDPYVNESISETALVTIGNAYLFAKWKEEVENITLLKCLPQCTRAIDLLHYLDAYFNGWEHEAAASQNIFKQFCSQSMRIQTIGFNEVLSDDEINALLRTSSWCGLIPVLDSIKLSLSSSSSHPPSSAAATSQKPKLRIFSKSLSTQLKSLWPLLPGDEAESKKLCLDFQMHRKKGMDEYRMRLAIIAQCIMPYVSSDKQKELFIMTEAAMQLASRDDIAINFKGTITSGMDTLTKTLFTKKSMVQGLIAAQIPFISKITADYISGVWQSLWLRIYENPKLRTIIVVIVASRGGFFLSHQKQLIEALAYIIKSLLKEL